MQYNPWMITISFRLPDNLVALLKRAAKERRVSKSRLLRDCIERTLQSQPKQGQVSCYDLARDLAGSVKGLPRDLATNPKYMKDFGK